VTISGGGGSLRPPVWEGSTGGGSLISWVGLAKREERVAAWREVGEVGVGTLRFLRGRWERRSCEVGMDSGPGADIVGGWVVGGWFWRCFIDEVWRAMAKRYLDR